MAGNLKDTLYGGVTVVNIPGLQGPAGKDAVVTPDMQTLHDETIAARDKVLSSVDLATATAENVKEVAVDIKASTDASVTTATEMASSARDSASAASTSASAASDSASAAASSEANAATSEANAKASETAAGTSATKASASEVNAKASETAASTSATNAKASEGNAKASETSAASSASAAATSATAATSSENTVKVYSEEAQAAAANAKSSEEVASASATNAKAAETNAKASATAAASSATAAASSATAAASSATELETAEANAKASETSAASSAVSASTSATNAKASEDAAASSASAAATSATNAKGSEDAVAANATAAQESATTASGYVSTAKAWAVQMDAPVEDGLYGAKYYAEQAMGGQIPSDWAETDTTAKSYIKNKPALATVATSGSYNDLTDTPTIPEAITVDSEPSETSTNPLQNKVIYKVVMGLAEVVDSIETLKADTSSLAAVATSGAYTDLTGTPTLATVATSGSYTDLTSRPTVLEYKETNMVALGFTAKSTVSIVDFFQALFDNGFLPNSVILFANRVDWAAQVTDGTNTMNMCGGLLFLSFLEDLSAASWGGCGGVFFPMGTVSSNIYKLTAYRNETEVTDKEVTTILSKGDVSHVIGSERGSIELTPNTTASHGGFIDFHWKGSSADYTSRIIESSSGTLSVVGRLTVSGALQGATVKATSDIRKKTDLTKPYHDLSSLSAYRYRFKNQEDYHVGLIAQEVQPILPEAVSEGEDGYLALDYNAVVAALVDEVNRLKERITQLEAKL